MHAGRLGRAALAGSLTVGILTTGALPADAAGAAGAAGAADAAGAGALPAGAARAAGAAPAASAAGAADHPHVEVFAQGTATQSQPDDITRLGSHIFVAWQNQVGADGTPGPDGANSTLVEYQLDGTVVQQWSLVGHIDGLTGDPARDDVIVSVNEDANSSLYTVDPETGEVKQYQFEPGSLTHGGGTDAISIYHGSILVSASNPDLTTPHVPAVYRVTLDKTGMAEATPVFFDDSTATVANTNAANHGQSVSLALTDPDSNEVVPRSSPRFGGDFVLDSQGDQQQVYMKVGDDRRPQLSVLAMSQSIDDSAWVTDEDGTLFVTDGTDNTVFTVTGDLEAGTTFVAVTPANANNPGPTPGPNYLGRLDLRTGTVTPVAGITGVQAKGLLFVP